MAVIQIKSDGTSDQLIKYTAPSLPSARRIGDYYEFQTSTKIADYWNNSNEAGQIELINEAIRKGADVRRIIELRMEGRKVEVGTVVTNLSGVATGVSRELNDFLGRNPNLPMETKAVILKSQEAFNEIRTKVEQVKKLIEDTTKLRNRVVDWVAGAFVGVAVTIVLQLLLSYLGSHPL